MDKPQIKLPPMEKFRAIKRNVPEGMDKVSRVIAYWQDILKRFGDSCVYTRTGGCSWGGLALTRQSADRESGDDTPEMLLRKALIDHADYRERVGPIVLKEIQARQRAESAEHRAEKAECALRNIRDAKLLPGADHHLLASALKQIAKEALTDTKETHSEHGLDDRQRSRSIPQDHHARSEGPRTP